jgi:hypothetical protein
MTFRKILMPLYSGDVPRKRSWSPKKENSCITQKETTCSFAIGIRVLNSIDRLSDRSITSHRCSFYRSKAHFCPSVACSPTNNVCVTVYGDHLHLCKSRVQQCTLMGSINALKIEFFSELYVQNQETRYFSASKPSRLMLFRETAAVYCEDHREHKGCVGRM